MPPELHSFLGASSAKRWLTCTPSARLGEAYLSRFGSETSPWAEEGTKAHALGELKIRLAAEMISRESYDANRSALGDIPEDMEHATDSYLDVVGSHYMAAKENDPSTKLFLEQRLDYGEWVPGGFGTGDCIIVSNTVLEIIDYKHGMGIEVDAVGNQQLRLYALGAYAKFGQIYDFDTVKMTIVQPRIDNLSSDEMPLEELLEWAVSYVNPRALLADKGEGDFVPGEHCRFCPIKAICAARAIEAMNVMRHGLTGVIDDRDIPKLLQSIDIAEDWIRDIRTYAEKQALKGYRWKGYKLVRGRKPPRKFTDNESVVDRLKQAGIARELFEATSLRSVADLEKELSKPVFEELLGDLVTQGEGKLNLVPESDKRPEYSAAENIIQEFNDLKEN